MKIRRVIATIMLISMVVLATGVAFGQTYPSKPIRIVTITVGSGVDFVARLVGQEISGPLGQPVIVDNRAGYAPPEIVSKAPSDGHTLLVAPNAFYYGPLLQKLSYDPVKDFAPISLLVGSPSILVVSPTLPVNSVKELIALAKSKPGALNYASGSTGGSGHLTAELFKSMANINIVRVPYKSTVLAFGDLATGQVHMMFEGLVLMGPLIKTGKMKGLAVTSLQPHALVPGLPTVAASLPGFEMLSIVSLFAPARTPEAIIKRLNQETVRVLSRADVVEKFSGIGVGAIGSSPEELATWMKSSMTNIGKVINEAGIRVD